MLREEMEAPPLNGLPVLVQAEAEVELFTHHHRAATLQGPAAYTALEVARQLRLSVDQQ